MDGANLNAILGRFKPGEAGFDVMHFNVHKTFSTPARRRRPGRRPGRGGGAARCRTCPTPRVLRAGRRHVPPRAARRAADARSAGCAASSATPASSCARTPTSGRTAAAACARSATTPCSRPTTSSRRLAGHLRPARTTGRASTSSWPRPPSIKARTGVRTLDIAKRLIDYGFHPPTIYFPLIVDEGHAHRADRDRVGRDARRVRRRAHRDRRRGRDRSGHSSRRRPHTAPVRRLDEATAARQPNLRWRPMAGAEMPCPD